MVTGNQSKIGGGDGGKDLFWILAIRQQRGFSRGMVARNFGENESRNLLF